MVTFFPYLYSCRRSKCSNLRGINPKKSSRATLIARIRDRELSHMRHSSFPAAAHTRFQFQFYAILWIVITTANIAKIWKPKVLLRKAIFIPRIWYSVKGTVTRFCACAATWFLFRRTVFKDWRFGEEIVFHRPWDARESHNISIQELFGPFGKF